MPGPARQPSGLRLLNGARPDKVNQAEPIPRGLLPVCPEGTAADVAAVFADLTRELDAMKIASSADAAALLVLAEAIVTHRRASEILATSNLLVTGVQGTLIRHPALSVQRDSAVTVRMLAREFGLTPAGRASVVVQPDEDGDNPFAGG